MNSKRVYLVILGLLLATGFSFAQEFYLDKFEQVGDLKVFQSLDDDSKWYYLADQIRIAQRNGKPQFSFLKFVTNEDTGSEGGITGGKGGGVVHMLVEFRVTEDQKRRAEQQLQRKYPGAVIAGPIIYRSGTFALISATLDEDGEYADKVVGVGRAPVMEGHKAAVSILLSKQGATLLWESFKTDTPDISINFEMEIAGYREPFEAKVTGNWNLISKHSNLALGLRASMIGLDVQRTVSELRQSNAIEVEVKGSDEMGDAMVTQIEGKLVDFIFEKINDPQLLQNMVEDKNLYSNVERANRIYDQNQRQRRNSSGSSSRSGSSSSGRRQTSSLQQIGLQGQLEVPRLMAAASMPGIHLYQASGSSIAKLRLPTLILRTGGNPSIHFPSDYGWGGDEEIEEVAPILRNVLQDYLNSSGSDSQIRTQCRGAIIRAIDMGADPYSAHPDYQATSRFNQLLTITFRDFSSADERLEHLMEIYFVEARAYYQRISGSGDTDEPRVVLGEAERIDEEDVEDAEDGEPRLILDEAEEIECGDTYGRAARVAFNRAVRGIINGGGSRAAKVNRIASLMQRELRQHTGSPANLSRLRANLNIIFSPDCFTETQHKIARVIQLMYEYVVANCGRGQEPIVYCDDSLTEPDDSGEVMDFTSDADEELDDSSVMDFSEDAGDDQASTDRTASDRDRQISKSGPGGSKSGGSTTTPRSSDANSGDSNREQAETPASSDSASQPEMTDERRASLEEALRSGSTTGDDSGAASTSGDEDQSGSDSNATTGESANASGSAAGNSTRASRPGARVYDQRRAQERGSSFALMAAYRVKRFKTSGTFSFSFNKKMLQNQVVTMAYNVGDLYNRYGNDPAIFKAVNLDDPVYKQREIIVFLDGQDKDAFDKYINYVTVSMRKKHQNGKLTQDELRIDKSNFNNEGNVFRMLYGWKGDSDREKWLQYEYKTTWSYHGGFSYETDWQSTDEFNITVTPPHRYRTIKLEADPDILQDEGVRLTTVTFYYKALGREMPPVQVSMRTNPDDLNKTIEYFHSSGIFDYEYELKWRVHGQYVSSGRLKGDEDFIFIDELP